MEGPTLSADEVRRLARLARLDVADAEIPDLSARLDALLGYVARLDAMDPADGREMPHLADEHTAPAPDQPGPMLDRNTLLGMAPLAFDAFVRVPKILGEGGGA